jgi:hypothetical protein
MQPHSGVAFLFLGTEMDNEVFLMGIKQRFVWTDGTHFITKVGYDVNGNWSYWVKTRGRKRALKIQHALVENQGVIKVTEELLKAGKPHDQLQKSLASIVDAYQQNTKKD